MTIPMAPAERTAKRQKLSPPVPSASSSQDPQSHVTTSPTRAAPSNASAPSQDAPSTPKRTSWYSGTWPRKAAPITQIARDSVASASSSAIETASVIKDKVTPVASRKSSLALTLGKGTPSKALPVDATTTKDHAMPESRRTSKEEHPKPLGAVDDKDMNGTGAAPADDSSTPVATDQSAPSAATTEQQAQPAQPPAAPRSWIGWLAGGEVTKAAEPAEMDKGDASEARTEPPKKDVEPSQTKPQISSVAKTQPSEPVVQEPPSNAATAAEVINTQRRSWLPIWNNATAAQSAPVISSPTSSTKPDANPDSKPDTNSAMAPTQNQKSDQPESATEPSSSEPNAVAKKDDQNQAPQQQQLPVKPSAWVFWSRDKSAETSSLKDAPREGEVAIAGTASQTRPRRASIDPEGLHVNDQNSPVVPTKAASLKGDKSAKPKAKESKVTKDIKDSSTPETTKVTSKGASATAIAPADAKTSRPASPAPSTTTQKKAYDHHLTPTLHETLKIPEDPSLFKRLTQLFYSPSLPPLKHLNLVKEPHRIKNALVIGVHGYFPAPLIQSVIGRPTGTSIKFADMAAKSIRKHTKAHNYECNVKTAALEGEGRIADRIDLLWKLLLNWINEIRRSDFVMVACHSQGVPVAIMLVAKLIHFGCIARNARVGICAMAGVSMGPFPEFKSRWISGSAGELFEFSDPESKVSKDYHAALDDVLTFGVRLTYVGSIDDQLVSLESSIFAPVTHPHIFRAVSIDNRIHAPSFLSHLVGFVLKLRNLGIPDHGLIRELSAPLAGSLYSGEGHSRLYEDEAIYDLAVSFALETTAMPGTPLIKRDVTSTGANPYILPFAMRGILEEDFVKTDLQNEATQLLQEFDDWKPTTKALKDVKFRLEGIRSKL